VLSLNITFKMTQK